MQSKRNGASFDLDSAFKANSHRKSKSLRKEDSEAVLNRKKTSLPSVTLHQHPLSNSSTTDPAHLPAARPPEKHSRLIVQHLRLNRLDQSVEDQLRLQYEKLQTQQLNEVFAFAKKKRLPNRLQQILPGRRSKASKVTSIAALPLDASEKTAQTVFSLQPPEEARHFLGPPGLLRKQETFSPSQDDFLSDSPDERSLREASQPRKTVKFAQLQSVRSIQSIQSDSKTSAADKKERLAFSRRD